MQLGIEPSSFSVNSGAHTPCLLLHNKNLVSVERIELALHAPKARVIPFHYTEIKTGAVIFILTTLPRWAPRQLIPYRIKLGAQCLVRTDDLSLTRRLRYHYANRAYTFIFMVDRGRIELPTEACKATVFPIILTAHKTWWSE